MFFARCAIWSAGKTPSAIVRILLRNESGIFLLQLSVNYCQPIAIQAGLLSFQWRFRYGRRRAGLVLAIGELCARRRIGFDTRVGEFVLQAPGPNADDAMAQLFAGRRLPRVLRPAGAVRRSHPESGRVLPFGPNGGHHRNGRRTAALPDRPDASDPRTAEHPAATHGRYGRPGTSWLRVEQVSY